MSAWGRGGKSDSDLRKSKDRAGARRRITGDPAALIRAPGQESRLSGLERGQSESTVEAGTLNRRKAALAA
jgi:hypothetical protein